MSGERGLQWKRTGPLPSCFMTEGHDVDNADTKWLCGSRMQYRDRGLGSGGVIRAVRGTGRQIGSCCRGVGERLPAHFPGLKGYPDRRRVLRERDGTASRAMKHLCRTSTTTKRRASGTRRARRIGSTRRSRRLRRVESDRSGSLRPRRRGAGAKGGRSARGRGARDNTTKWGLSGLAVPPSSCGLVYYSRPRRVSRPSSLSES